jgi:hypothetical protein
MQHAQYAICCVPLHKQHIWAGPLNKIALRQFSEKKRTRQKKIKKQ